MYVKTVYNTTTTMDRNLVTVVEMLLVRAKVAEVVVAKVVVANPGVEAAGSGEQIAHRKIAQISQKGAFRPVRTVAAILYQTMLVLWQQHL